VKGHHTHTNTGHVRSNRVQEGNHMPAFCDRAFQTRVECVAREQGDKGWLVCITRAEPIFLDNGLEASDAANRLRRTRPGSMISN
jgi:hypothetical protein